MALVSGLYPFNGVEFCDGWSRRAKCFQQMEILKGGLWSTLVSAFYQQFLGIPVYGGLVRFDRMVCARLALAAHFATKTVVIRRAIEQTLGADSP